MNDDDALGLERLCCLSGAQIEVLLRCRPSTVVRGRLFSAARRLLDKGLVTLSSDGPSTIATLTDDSVELADALAEAVDCLAKLG